MIQSKILPLELRKLGLSEKETLVYLAALKLGYSSVLKIAKEAKISRPTAYQVIRGLIGKGLIAKLKDGNKKYFAAESPDKLMRGLKMQRRELKEKEREFTRIIAALRNKYWTGKERGVKIYKGKGGFNVLLDELLTTQSKKIYILTGNKKFISKKIIEDIYRKIRKRLGKIEIKELRATGAIENKEDECLSDYLEIKKINPKKLPLAETIIIHSKIAIFSPEKMLSVSVENKLVIDLIKSLFICIWRM